MGAGAPAGETDAPEGTEDGSEQPFLPEGFFDDPELDAKVRGIETPAQRAQRELEDGLKKFEREMVVEIEQAEETRNEIDEEKAGYVAAEEEEFQSDLRGRLATLRKRAAEKNRLAQEAAAAKQAEKDAAPAAVDDAEDAGDSGSDVEFDWRAKDFG